MSFVSSQSDSTKNPGGLLCPEIVSEEIGSLKTLYGSRKKSPSDSQDSEERLEGENSEEWNFGLFADHDDDLGHVAFQMGILFP